MCKKILIGFTLGFVTVFSAYSLALSHCDGSKGPDGYYTISPVACCNGAYSLDDWSTKTRTGDFWMNAVKSCGQVSRQESSNCNAISPVVAYYGEKAGLINQKLILRQEELPTCK